MKRNWAAEGYDVEDVPPEPTVSDKKPYDGPLEDWESFAVNTAVTAAQERAELETDSGNRADLDKLLELALSVTRNKGEDFWKSLLSDAAPDKMDTLNREIASMFGNNQEAWLSRPYDTAKNQPYDAPKTPYDAPKEAPKTNFDSKA